MTSLLFQPFAKRVASSVTMVTWHFADCVYSILCATVQFTRDALVILFFCRPTGLYNVFNFLLHMALRGPSGSPNTFLPTFVRMTSQVRIAFAASL